MNWRDRFKARFEQLKATEGLTQEKLGEMIGVGQGTVGHWLNGRRTPDDLDTYNRLAEALGVHPAWLLFGLDEDLIGLQQMMGSASSADRQAVTAVVRGILQARQGEKERKPA